MSGALSEIISFTGQSFNTYPVPNFNASVYALSIRQPGDGSVEYLTYTFPMSPQLVQKSWTEMNTIYDTQGTTDQRGVNRDPDIFGKAPPFFTIEGSTGNQRHRTDGYIGTGLDAIKALEKFFDIFAQLNQSQLEKQETDLYTLEFLDYYMQDYWQIVPIGEQGRFQSADRPLWTNYRFRWAAIRSVSAPPAGVDDALLNVFGGDAVATAGNVAQNLGAFTQLYLPSGLNGNLNDILSSGGLGGLQT